MDQGLPYDPEDVETAYVKLRISGPQDVAWAALAEFEAYVDQTEHLEGERTGPDPDAARRALVAYELFTDRTGVIAPAIERLCAILAAAPEIEAGIKVPGYSRTPWGWERDWVVDGRIVGSG